MGFVGALVASHSSWRGAFNFAPGLLTAQAAVAYAVGAEFEWYDSSRLSMRADVYALTGKSKPGVLQQNYQMMLGVVHSFNSAGPLVPYLGFQPGFGFSSVDNGTASGLYIYPILSPVLGLHVYAGENWHMTANLRYVFGELHYGETGAVYLSELRLGLGIGYGF
jgi:hypothetical protein